MSFKKVSVEKEFIIEAHRAASSEWKAKLERQFPELFDDGVVTFGTRFVTTLDSNEGNPFFIGDCIAPEGLERKCLVLRGDYKAEIKEEGGRQLIVIKKVK